MVLFAVIFNMILIWSLMMICVRCQSRVLNDDLFDCDHSILLQNFDSFILVRLLSLFHLLIFSDEVFFVGLKIHNSRRFLNSW
jgi:hypothetical protein